MLSSINWHGLLEKRSRRKLCVLPNHYEDEAMFRDTLKNLGHTLSPEKQVHIGLAAVREGPRTQDKAERLMVFFCSRVSSRTRCLCSLIC